MDNNISKEDLLKVLDQCLFEMAYKDIEKASIQGEAKLGGFILGACFIDAVAGFYAGIDREKAKKGSGKRFKDYVKRYMKKYDPERLWEDLRCGLVHSYAEGGTYVFTDANKAGFHFNKISDGRILLNLEDFCADLRQAYRDYRNDILDDDKVYDRAVSRLKMGIMAISRI